MRLSTIPAAALLVLSSIGAVSSDEFPVPDGPVVLTVSGSIAEANRPVYDERRDVFFAYHERRFGDAFIFDLEVLEGLGTRKVQIEYENWPGPMSLSGPLLADVLETAGCARGPLSTLSLDGYATEISEAQLAANEWILATKANGRPLAIGGRGPLWLIYDPPGERPALLEESETWPWALFFIRCG